MDYTIKHATFEGGEEREFFEIFEGKTQIAVSPKLEYAELLIRGLKVVEYLERDGMSSVGELLAKVSRANGESQAVIGELENKLKNMKTPDEFLKELFGD
ncbi:MAG: hypothetical protein AAB507_01250 [Patescibacteria group bacterium]